MLVAMLHDEYKYIGNVVTWYSPSIYFTFYFVTLPRSYFNSRSRCSRDRGRPRNQDSCRSRRGCREVIADGSNEVDTVDDDRSRTCGRSP